MTTDLFSVDTVLSISCYIGRFLQQLQQNMESLERTYAILVSFFTERNLYFGKI